MFDPNQQLHYYNWLLTNITPVLAQPTLQNDFFFFDEAWFSLSRYVNSQNNRYQAADNPHVNLEAPLHLEKIGVWCALSTNKIITPLFSTTTIKGEVYLNIIEQFVALLEETDRYGWFKQDNTCSHMATHTMAVY